MLRNGESCRIFSRAIEGMSSIKPSVLEVANTLSAHAVCCDSHQKMLELRTQVDLGYTGWDSAATAIQSIAAQSSNL